MTNLDSILKSRDITLPTKVHLVKAMVFPVVMYGCESWPMKKAERQRINASELGSWRRLLRAPASPVAAYCVESVLLQSSDQRTQRRMPTPRAKRGLYAEDWFGCQRIIKEP